MMLKKCNCGKSCERFRLDRDEYYSKCHSCWKLTDGRFLDQIKVYLDEMTNLAHKFNMVVAEPLEADTYEPKYGPKLYWDTEVGAYVMKLPDGRVVP
jgi:hypothetical protein